MPPTVPPPHPAPSPPDGAPAATDARACAEAATRASELRFRLLVEHAPEVIVVHRAGVLLLVNRAGARLLAVADHTALAGRAMHDFVHPDDREATRARLALCEAAAACASDAACADAGSVVEFRIVRADGTCAEVEATSVGVRLDCGVAVQTVLRDVTARRAAERTARERDERLRLALDAASLSVWEWDVPGDRVLLAASETTGLAGTTPRTAPDVATRFTGFLAQVHPQDRARIWAAVERASDEGADLEVEYRVLRDDGAVGWHYSRGHVTADEAGEPSHVLGVSMDITDRKQLEEQIAHQAFHDPLTGLANRVLFRDRVEHALARAARRGEPPAVLFLDLDNFKTVNDGFGHAAGDQLLMEVAGRLTRTLRTEDTCARLGGDEFAVLLEDVPEDGPLGAHAAYVAERLLAAFGQPVVIEGTELFIGVSVGIAAAVPGDTAEVLLRNADLAMYRAKNRGKGRYEVFEPTMHAAVRRRLELEAELRRAVEEPAGQLVLHYQPIAALAEGAVVGFEALVRWRHPSRGLVPPGEFIGIAEETGLIVPLGRWVLREACRQAAEWQQARAAAMPGARPLSVSVNLSGRQLALAELPAEVEAALRDTGLPPASLVLEMTESTLVDHGLATLDRLLALRALGVRLAIDDFGTGYSSLGYLERFPVDLLKIDKAFVDRVGTKDAESPLARAILGLGGALGMRVVAEGIETNAQWVRLRELGCELGQGYFIARPLPADEAVKCFSAPAA